MSVSTMILQCCVLHQMALKCSVLTPDGATDFSDIIFIVVIQLALVSPVLSQFHLSLVN